MNPHETTDERRSRKAWLWAARIFVAIGLLTVLSMGLMGGLDDPPAPFDDPAIRNIVTLVSLFVAGLAIWLWVCFGSRASKRLRLAFGLGTGLAMLALIVAFFQLRDRGLLSFSGSLMPRLMTREKVPEAIASAPSGKVDLTTTTDQDFSQFLGPNRNGWLGSVTLARDWQSVPPRLLWQREIGAGWSSFAAVNGYAVTLEQRGDQEWVACYEVATGQPVWGRAIDARHETTLGGIGPRSTPTIHAGRVYTLGGTGILQCLSQNGELIWSDDLRHRYGLTDDEDEQHVMFGRAASPLIAESLVIVPGGGPPGKAKNLVAFDQRTGRVVWESENKLSNGLADQIAYASPTLATLAGRSQVLIVNESTASGHDPETGRRLWSHPWPGRSNGNASVSQAVPVGENRVLLTKGYGGGAELIELVDNGEVELTVKSVWKVSRVLQTKFSNVVVYEQHVYALSEGILECVALDSGRRRWKSGRFGHGQILGVGDLLLVLAEDGQLHLIEMNPAKLAQLASVPALEGKSWNNLCLVGKRLLLRNAEMAVCFELP